MWFQWLLVVACGLVVLVSIASWRQHSPGQRRAQLVTAVVAGCILVVGVVRLLNNYSVIH
jgi:riboflavin transporter FmnP